jgi:hypothetical protein
MPQTPTRTGTKTCTRCKIEKPTTAFNSATDNRYPGCVRLYSNCKLCSTIKTREERGRRQERSAGRPRATRCEVCLSTIKICWDHDHVTGAFRGWICEGCNLALGAVHDNPDVLRALAEYLERSTKC